MSIRICIVALAAWLCALPALAQPTPLSTSFTYQGELKNGGALATGVYDLRFRLYDAATGSTQVGPTLCLANVQVTGGRFTVEMDFGQQFAIPRQRFLEIDVRTSTGLGCGNSGGFVVLSPRQPLTAAPVANHAKSAFALDSADGSRPNAVIVDNNGRVGVGIAAPGAMLHVMANQGGSTPGEGVRIRGPSVGADNLAYISFTNATDTSLGFVGDGSGGDNSIFLSAASGDAVLNTSAGRVLTATAGGRVGIGTSTPAATLDVRGDIRLGSGGQYRATSGPENLRIVRGVFAANGAIITGSGFQVTNPAFGRYTITFNEPFLAPPAVTATAHDDLITSVPLVATTAGVTTTFARIDVRVSTQGGGINAPVHFIAIGPR